MNGQIYVVSGPSGVGKSTLVRKIRKELPDLGYSVSHTSRAPRTGEINGVDYHFVKKSRFQSMINQGSFVEWEEIYNDLYGTAYVSLNDLLNHGSDMILDLDNKGAANIRRHYTESVMIYILPPSMKELEKRLRARAQDTDNAIKLRIGKAREEIQNSLWYDFFIINDNPLKSLEDLKSIILSNRCRHKRMLSKVKEIIDNQGAQQ
ncbi:MAG: guanylate kinase [Deltaproteobacteria bacterium]|nr:guanylate kinase [Deltaproteobacteria bacterium]